MKTSKTYYIGTVDGMRKAENAYIRYCNKYNKVEKVFNQNYTYVYFKLYE